MRIFLYLFFFLILEINNQCDKETPIRKKSDNNCYNTYCTENEFQNGDCIIDNPTIKAQWLNKLFYLGDNIINILTVIEMPNNDIYFISSKLYVEYIYIYRLKSSGEIYYNENNNNFKIVLLSPFVEERQVQVTINGVGLNIDNKEYIFICHFYEIKCQLIEFENGIIFNQNLGALINTEELVETQGEFLTILNLNQNNKILLGFENYGTYDGTWADYMELSIIDFIKDEDILSYEIKHLSEKEYAFDLFFDITCFVTARNFVECLAQYENKFKVEIYDESLNYLNSIAIDTTEYTEISFAKCIHLKNEIGVFSYYRSSISDTGNPLNIQIKELINPYNLIDVINDENHKFEISIDKNYFSDHISSSLFFNAFLIKLSDNKFSFAYYSDYENGVIIIVIFDLYGDNEDNLLLDIIK